MLETVGDLWTVPADYRCITINGVIRSNGDLVMGAGNAYDARIRYPGIARQLGELVAKHRLHTFLLTDIPIIAFPTKHNWKDKSDLRLIARSAVELVYLADMHHIEKVVLPRPGCGCGKLSWKSQVRPQLERLLDDRFVVVSQDA